MGRVDSCGAATILVASQVDVGAVHPTGLPPCCQWCVALVVRRSMASFIHRHEGSLVEFQIDPGEGHLHTRDRAKGTPLLSSWAERMSVEEANYQV